MQQGAFVGKNYHFPMLSIFSEFGAYVRHHIDKFLPIHSSFYFDSLNRLLSFPYNSEQPGGI